MITAERQLMKDLKGSSQSHDGTSPAFVFKKEAKLLQTLVKLHTNDITCIKSHP
jgi:hypothetical protein